ncbi:hypothetical protein [Nonomuraea sp. NPDC049480]
MQPAEEAAGGRRIGVGGIGPIGLEQISVIPSDGVTHVRYRVTRP